MPLFEDIRYFYTKTKEKITSSVQTLCSSYYVQAFYQGFAAPKYSFHSLQTMWNASHELRTSVQSIVKLNGEYAKKSFLCYLVYYRVINPLLSSDNEDDYTHYFLNTINGTFYIAMFAYLFYEMADNFKDNVLHTLTVVKNAAIAAPPLSEIQTCGCEDQLAGGRSFILYMANRYAISRVSNSINEAYPNAFGMSVSFILESFSLGFPLVEYKLAAVNTCTHHRTEVLWRHNKLYFFWFGASFVTCLWFLNYLEKLCTGADNLFFRDAIFCLLFDLYAVTAIARTEKFPGGGKPRIDFLAFLIYLLETKPIQYVYQHIKKKYSFEELAKSESVGAFVVANEESITQWIGSTKRKLIIVDKIQSYAEWFGSPFVTIPTEVKTYCQKRFWSSKIESVEKFVRLAKETHLRRMILMTARSSEIKSIFWKDPKTVISRETDSDDEWEDFVEVLKDNCPKELKEESSELIKDQYFSRKPSSNNIHEGWVEIDDEAILTRANSGLFRKHRPLNKAAQKMLDEMKGQQKNLVAVTGLITSSLGHPIPTATIFERELKRSKHDK